MAGEIKNQVFLRVLQKEFGSKLDYKGGLWQFLWVCPKS
jgi:hypothetical protein